MAVQRPEQDETGEVIHGAQRLYTLIYHDLEEKYLPMLGPVPWVLYTHLLKMAGGNPEARCWPSFNTLARQTRTSRTVIIETLALLEKTGLIKREKRPATPGSPPRSNVYKVIDPFYEDLLRRANGAPTGDSAPNAPTPRGDSAPAEPTHSAPAEPTPRFDSAPNAPTPRGDSAPAGLKEDSTRLLTTKKIQQDLTTKKIQESEEGHSGENGSFEASPKPSPLSPTGTDGSARKSSPLNSSSVNIPLPLFPEEEPASTQALTPYEKPREQQSQTGPRFAAGVRIKTKAQMIQEVFDTWKASTGRNGRTLLDEKRSKLISTALKSYPLEDLLDAVRGWEKSPHHRGENDRHTVYNDLELILRDSRHIEQFRGYWRGEGLKEKTLLSEYQSGKFDPTPEMASLLVAQERRREQPSTPQRVTIER
jgi:hypothetical protein